MPKGMEYFWKGILIVIAVFIIWFGFRIGKLVYQSNHASKHYHGSFHHHHYYEGNHNHPDIGIIDVRVDDRR